MAWEPANSREVLAARVRTIFGTWQRNTKFTYALSLQQQAQCF